MNRDEVIGFAKVATLIVACISVYDGVSYGVSYLVGTPLDCVCHANISPDLADASLIHNSVGDATAVIIKTDGPLQGEINICYPKKPSRGNVDYNPGLPERGCEVSNTYELILRNHGKTDTESALIYEIDENTLTPPYIVGSKRRATEEIATSGRLDLDRSKDICKFQANAWNSAAIGEMKCGNERWYFNLWSFFPQTNRLFYTRMFYWLHKRRPEV
jgi:hypothetical protein